MGTPITPPRVVADASGRVRMKLKRGIGDEHDPGGPHVHYFRANGARVDRHGVPTEARVQQNFLPIRWDFEDPKPETYSGECDATAALGVLHRSRTFTKVLDAALRAGWVVELAAPGFGAGCRKGPHTISLDTSRRSAFVARMAHEIAMADALAEPLPPLDVASPGFVHGASVFLMRRWARAALAQARIRDEILVGGGPDIGGPGLRGLQLEAYDVSVRQPVAEERVVDAVAFSVDGELVSRFSTQTGPPLARNVASAFLPPATPIAGRTLTPEMLDVLENVRRLPALDGFHVARAFGVAFAPRPLAIESGYIDVQTALPATGPFAWVELREGRPGSGLPPRLLLVPRYEMSQFDLAAWFGLGGPCHVDLRQNAFATAVYAHETRPMYVTYRANEQRSLRTFTIVGP